MLFLSDILTKAVARLKIDTDLERGLVLVYLAAYSVNVFFINSSLVGGLNWKHRPRKVNVLNLNLKCASSFKNSRLECSTS